MRAGLLTWAFLLGGALGCSSGRPRTGDAALDAADAAIDAGSDASADAAVDLAADAGEPPDTRPARTGVPLPTGVAPPRRLLGGAAKLTGDGQTSCTHQDPPSGDGDRWCVFEQPAAGGKTELWVIDVSAAARGEVPVCDGSSPRCLRLTANLWVGGAVVGATYPYSDQFDGDTLVYYADAVSKPDESFRGPVYAWRPGWAQGRAIAPSTGFLCFGHPQAPVATCIDELVGDPMQPQSVRLRAGRLDDATSGPLPEVATVRPLLSNGGFALQVGFSRSGEHFAYSSADPDPTVAALKVVATREVGTAPPKVAVTDVTAWEIARDDHKVYVLRGPREDASFFVADFPAGGAETAIDTHVGDFLLLGETATDRGVIYITELATDHGAFRLLRDRTTPATVQTVFTYRGFLEYVHVSPDLRFTAWLDEGFTGRVVPHDGSPTCVLNSTRATDVFFPTFLDDAGLMFWTEAQPDSDRRDGFLGPPQACQQRQKFGEGIAFHTPIGNRGLVFGDEEENLDDGVTLKYAKVTAGKAWPAEGATRVAEHVKTPVVLVGRDPLLIVYQKARDPNEGPGVFVFGPVPF